MENTNELEVTTTSETQAPVSENDVMTQLLKKMDSQLFFTRILAIASSVIVVILVIVAFVVIPPAVKSLKAAEQVMQVANSTLEEATAAISTAEEALGNVTSMTDNISATSQNLNEFVLENAETMSSAMKDIDSIDFAGLNQAIEDLQAAVGPFANLMRKFN